MNGQPYIIVALARDKRLKTMARIPAAKEWSLLKSLFNNEYTRNVRKYDMIEIQVIWVER